MFKTSMVRTLLAGVSILSLCAVHAQAQSVDYGALQQMFGEPITTSVTGSPQRVSEAPAAMTIVTQDDIRRSGADNIPDILQFVTGIDTRRSSFSQSDVAVRGYDQQLYPRILVLVNGRQVYLDDFGYVDWNAIPVQLGEIRQIEIVKGPTSALFGFNAAAGVINIITYDPLLDSVNTATLRGGTQHLGEGEAVSTVHLGKTFGARVSIGGLTASEFKAPPAAEGFPNPRNGRLNADLLWQVTPKLELRAQGSLVDNRFTEYYPTSLYNAAENRTNDMEAGAALESRFGLIDLDAYRNEAFEQYGHITNSNVVRVIKLSDLLKLGASNTVRVGLEYRNNLGTNDQGNGVLGIYGGTINYDDYAANIMWNTSVTSKLSFVNAVRLDYAVLHSDATLAQVAGITQALYNKTTITAPSFNSGLVYAVTEKDTLRLTAARGLQMPSLLSLGLQSISPGVAVVGSPTLSPTAVWNIDLGYDRALPAWHSSVTVDAFLQRNTDLVPAGGDGPATFEGGTVVLASQNAGSSNQAGIEIGLKGKSPNGLRWNASYRFSTISDDIMSTVAPSISTDFAHGTPTNAIILGAGYAIAKWEFDLNGRWQSGFRDYGRNVFGATIPVEIGDYVVFAARIGYDLTKHITLAGTAQQFNLARIQQDAALAVERRFIASVTFHY